MLIPKGRLFGIITKGVGAYSEESGSGFDRLNGPKIARIGRFACSPKEGS